jgi:hypothetical protein
MNIPLPSVNFNRREASDVNPASPEYYANAVSAPTSATPGTRMGSTAPAVGALGMDIDQPHVQGEEGYEHENLANDWRRERGARHGIDIRDAPGTRPPSFEERRGHTALHESPKQQSSGLPSGVTVASVTGIIQTHSDQPRSRASMVSLRVFSLVLFFH